MALFRDRIEAGRRLAEELSDLADEPGAIVLGLPRGGVPLACIMARELRIDVDLFIVRKLGHPRQRELAIGAIATGGIRVLNLHVSVPADVIEAVTQKELLELRRREQVYRGDRPLPRLAGRRVILVDDGLATGSTMLAAVEAVRRQQPAAVIVAVPVAPPGTVAELRAQVDAIVCPEQPEDFRAIGQFYSDFSPTTDEEVCELLSRAWAAEDQRHESALESGAAEPPAS